MSAYPKLLGDQFISVEVGRGLKTMLKLSTNNPSCCQGFEYADCISPAEV